MHRKINLTIPQAILITAIIILATSTISVLAATGSTDSTNAPGLSASYTLEDIYVRLVNGTAGSQSTFNEPAVAPGTGSMHDLNDIMAAAPAQDNTNGATAAEVQAGNTFWGLTNGEWGPQTGQRYGGCVCEGHMVGDTGTRWCDNEDGTITDLHNNCLVWVKITNLVYPVEWSRALEEAYRIHEGVLVNDGSVMNDWRLPSLIEYKSFTKGIDPVSTSNPQGFTGFTQDFYWSSTTYLTNEGEIRPWIVRLTDGHSTSSHQTDLNSFIYVRNNKNR